MANKISEDQAKAIKSLLESHERLNDLSGLFTEGLDEQLKKLQEQIETKEQMEALGEEEVANIQAQIKLMGIQRGLVFDTFGKFQNLNNIGSSFVKTLNNLKTPQLSFLTLLSLSADRFSELDLGAENFRKDTGLLASQTKLIESNVREISRDMAQFGVGVAEAYAAAKGLTDTFGDQFMASNKQNVEYVALMNANFGVGADISSEVLQNFMGIGKMSSETARYMTTAAASLSKAAGIPFNKVMQDVAKASGETLAAIRGNVPELIKASVEARRLGTDINAVGAAASRLLDFQASVGEEMEASVLMGKDLNLQKARELAYAGDLAGLAQEQSRIVQNAGKMDFYQQKALANALGMSVEQVTKMQAKQQELSDLRKQDPDFARKYEEEMRKMNDLGKESNEDLKKKYEQELKTQQIQGEQTKLANQFKEIMTDLADILVPVVKGLFLIANILVGILRPLGFIFKVFGSIYDTISLIWDKTQTWDNIVNNLTKSFKDLFSSVGAGILSTIGILLLFTKGLAPVRAMMWNTFVTPFKAGISGLSNLKNLARSLISGAPAKTGLGGKIMSGGGEMITSNTVPTGGAEAKGGMIKSLSESLKGISPAKLFAVGSAMIMFASALYILAKAGQEFNTVDWNSLGKMGVAALGLLAFTGALIAMSVALDASVEVIAPALLIMGMFSATMLAMGYAAKLLGEGFHLVGESLSLFANREAINGITEVTAAIHELNKEISNVSLLKVGALAALNVSAAAAGVAGGGAGSAEVVGKLDELIGLMKSGAIAVNIDSSRANYLLARGQKERGALGAV
jgi:hypothetical protein